MMEDQKRLRLFMDRILEIKPRYGDIASNGIPGMGMPNMGADLTNSLRKMAGLFAKAYVDQNVAAVEVKYLAEQLEAALMLVTTVGVSDGGSIETILDELHQLLATRASVSLT